MIHFALETNHHLLDYYYQNLDPLSVILYKLVTVSIRLTKLPYFSF